MNTFAIEMLVTIVLPLVGFVVAGRQMHQAVFNAETPTKKKQLNTLYFLVFVHVLFGIVEAGVLLYTKPSAVLPVYSAIVAGALGLVGSVMSGSQSAKQLEQGFMNHEERYTACRNKAAFMVLLSAAGMAFLLVSVFAVH
ncbi:MAG: hypothetical protein PUE98_04360 [Galactobacillus timonensis]|uniref:hypothetical protein n=1 Tax=Galactobacillus timonensis TaxID=2041840 RepID=UPI00240A5649|nr:hypothetical protein [Galactobacillus timonensis]MDD6369210.1 hypothetical protein [Galactobacillus timonensis]MDD6599680.1 hypothetical protein [Galactobacillus timonensis]